MRWCFGGFGHATTESAAATIPNYAEALLKRLSHYARFHQVASIDIFIALYATLQQRIFAGGM